MHVHAVIGGAFGDEGKGSIIHQLAQEYGPDSPVIRFNGSAQAGHTVVANDGRRHVFHHFGSGSFAGCITYLSSDFVCHPIMFNRELEDLWLLGLHPIVFAHPVCNVTTPYDMIINQSVERNRGGSKHGSCGIGFGETIERSNLKEYRIRIFDLQNSLRLRRILEEIRECYVPHRFRLLKCLPSVEERELLDSNIILEKFIDDCQRFVDYVSIREHPGFLRDSQHIIGEASQGLLLDQNSSFFPHVTRSNTGSLNLLRMFYSEVDAEFTITYVTRAYTVRHGAGPFPHELLLIPYLGIRDTTNIDNPYQGSLRYSYLNLDLLAEALGQDQKILMSHRRMAERNIALTCLDQVPYTVNYIWKGEIHDIAKDDLPDFIRDVIGLPVKYIRTNP